MVFLAMNIGDPFDSVIQSSVLASIAGIKVPTLLHSESSISYNIIIRNDVASILMLAECYLSIA